MENRSTHIITIIAGSAALLGTLFLRKKLEKFLAKRASDLAADVMARESGLSEESSRQAMQMIVQ